MCLKQRKRCPGIATRFVATGDTENDRGQSTLQLGDLHSVSMKLDQSEIQTSREGIRDTRNHSENQTTVRDLRRSRRELLRSTVTAIETPSKFNHLELKIISHANSLYGTIFLSSWFKHAIK
jgi:hypothetical protein